MYFKEKLQIFVFGLSIGLLAGCLFFIFKLDSYVRKIDMSILTQKQNVSEQVVSPVKENRETKTKEKNNIKFVQL